VRGGETAEGINEYNFIQCQRFREGVKWAAIRRLIKKEGAVMLCLQETKKEVIDKAMCQAL